MSFKDLVNGFQNGVGEDSSRKSLDKENPEALLLFNPSINEILESLEERQATSLERYEKITNKMDLLESKVSDLLSFTSDLGEKIGSLQTKIAYLEDQLDEIKSNTVDKEVLNELQEEAKRYRNDWFRKRLSRTVRKLIRFYDNLDYLPNNVDVQNLQREVLNILKTQDLERIELGGEKFDSEYMKAIDTMEVADPEKDLLVKEIVRDGFQYTDGKIIRPIEVKITRFNKGGQ
mgnify:CR=1 FL=1